MTRRPFPIGLVVTLVLLWLGFVGAIAWGWWSLRSVPLPSSPSSGAGIATPRPAAAGEPGSEVASRPTPPKEAASGLVWSQDGLWRFMLKAGGAALVAILFLLIAVGIGLLVQEKAESVDE
jgi:hypothetical protein